MSPIPGPFSSQPGPIAPAGSATSTNEAGRPPLPPRRRPLPPDASHFSLSERADPIPNSSSQPFYANSGTTYVPVRSCIPHSQATVSNAEPAGWANKPFSFRSTLGQFMKTPIFGHPGSAPFTPSYASRVTINGVELGQVDLVSLQTLLGPVSPGTYW